MQQQDELGSHPQIQSLLFHLRTPSVINKEKKLANATHIYTIVFKNKLRGRIKKNEPQNCNELEQLALYRRYGYP